MKSLETIQILSKVGRILSKIYYICCIVGFCVCGASIASLPFGQTGIFKIGGVPIYGIIVDKTGMELDSLYSTLAGVMIFCIGQAVTAKYAQNYFAHELEAGTPFDMKCSKELFRLGILTIAVSFGTLILARIVGNIIADVIGCGEAYEAEIDDSIAFGVMFIVTSIICKYGAELMAASQPKEEKSDTV